MSCEVHVFKVSCLRRTHRRPTMTDINRPSSVEKCIDDITECSICNDVLQENRCLPCLHTFCLKCLESYKKMKTKGKTLACPICRREFPAPKSIANLSRNFFIDKLIDAHKRKQQDLPKICDICEDTNAPRFCCDCHQSLCLSCEKQHRKIKAISTHRIIDSAMVTDTQELSSRSSNCNIHTMKEAEVYCHDCKMLICWQCKYETHGIHASIEISSASKNLTTKLAKHIEQISQHVRTKQDGIQKLKEREKLYTDEIDVESANIYGEISRLYREINENGEKLKKALTTSTAIHLNKIHEQHNKLETDVIELKKHKVYIEQLIHLGNVRDLCEYTEKLISETARMTAENDCNIIVPPVTHLSHCDIQNLLIGRTTNIDEQYEHNENQRQEIRPLSNSSKDERAKGKLQHSQSIGKLDGTEKKLEQKLRRRNTTSETELPIVSSGDDYAYALKHLVSETDYGDSVLTSPDGTPYTTQIIVAEAPSKSSKNLDECFQKYKWTLMRELNLEDRTVICGVTTLNSNIYSIFQHKSTIHVYDSAGFVLRSTMKVEDLKNPNDITSCNFNGCLYICDWGKVCIFRVDIGETKHQQNWSIGEDLGGISVTTEHSVLLAGFKSNTLKEYTSNGKLMRSINLENGFSPWHAIRLHSSDFLVCQGDNLGGNHRVCLIDANGKLKNSFGGEMGSGEDHLCGPYHLAVDASGLVFVSDCNNRRILLLSRDLKFMKEIIPSSANVLRRARRMHLDDAVGRLYVADNETKSGKTKGGRILVFSIS